MTAMRFAAGTASCASSRYLPQAGTGPAMPVTLPPGWASVATSPNLTGSATPTATIGIEFVTRRAASASLDHPIGAQQHGLRDHDAERLRGLAVDDELVLRRLHDRKVARLRAAQHAVEVRRDARVGAAQACAVSHEAAVLGLL